MYTTQQHRQNRIAAALGYKIAEDLSASNFAVGDGVIVLTKKGEPVMSGTVQKVFTSPGGVANLTVNNQDYCENDYMFRRM